MPKLLILAPTFFPDPRVGAIRVTQWARHLPDFGWTPMVLCRHMGYTATEESLAENVHSQVQVRYLGPRRRSIADGGHMPTPPTGFRAAGLHLLRTVSVPDAWVWKWKAVLAEACSIAAQWRPDVVLSSSPYHSIHIVGRAAAQAAGAAWVADFRDPYLIDSRYAVRGLRHLFGRQHREFERSIYRDASLCIHAIPFHARWASLRYSFARGKIRILTNGIPSELLDEEFLRSADRSPRVSIRATGRLGHGAVTTIAGALRQLVDMGLDAEFRHVGRAWDADDAVPADLRHRLQLRGPVSHAEALREVAGADVLLKFDDLEGAKVAGLSSKLFEYLAVGRPIVVVNPTRADRQLLRRLPWCSCLRDPQPDALAETLKRAIAADVVPSEEWLNSFRQQYNRRNQTQQLAGWLDELVAKTHSG